MVKSCSQKKLVSLNVEKHNDTHHAIVAGEANGSLVKKVLKKLDKCNYVWTNGEMNNVSESAGLLTASLPILAVTTVGSAINNAVFKPLARAVGFKGLRCKKRKHESDDECDSEDEHDSEDECDSEDEHDSDDDEDHGCKKNDCKKKKNWLSRMWDKMYKKNDKNGGCRKLNVKSKSVKPKSVKPKSVKPKSVKPKNVKKHKK